MEKKGKNVTVFGSGSFGTAMAFIAAKVGVLEY
jgi:glycerol-3-phosphate dehydrogenase